MPNREVISKWVEALRSGQYTQTTGRLNRLVPSRALEQPVGMCCLGVLCELAVEAGVVQRMNVGELVQYGEETHVLPQAVKEWAGFDFDNPYVDHVVEFDGEFEEVHDPITLLNDDHRMSFPAIADVIEATYLAKSDAGQPA